MRFTVLVLLFLFPFKFFGQINPADSTVQVVAYWDKAEKHTYALTWQKMKVTGKDTVITQDIRYKADVTVLDSTTNSYIVEWKYKDYSFGNITGKQIEQSGMGSVIQSFQNTAARFTTDETGSFKELVNWEEIRDKFKSSFDFIKSTLKLPGDFPVMNEDGLSRTNIEEIAIKDIQLFYMFYGIKLNLGVPIEEQVDNGNELTGPLKSDISLLLEQIDFENNLYKLTYYQSYDEATIARTLLPLISSMLPDAVSDTEKQKLSTFKFKSFEDFYFCLMHDSGWPASMTYDRVITFENNEQGIERRTVNFTE